MMRMANPATDRGLALVTGASVGIGEAVARR
jgi:NADP-dependent 3-hydroxy acid dehydrogenase YdfG